MAGGKQGHLKRTYFDWLAVVLTALLNPFIPYKKVPLVIPDKIEIRYCKPLSGDITLLAREIAETDYYLRIHTVTDEGYNLIAQYNTMLQDKLAALTERHTSSPKHTSVVRVHVKAKNRPLTAVRMKGGYWKAGHFHLGRLSGEGIMRDGQGRIVSALWDADTIVTAIRRDSLGVYQGQMDKHYQASGQGTYDATDGSHYEGFWENDIRQGFGFESSPHHQVRVGNWKNGKFLGEKLKYTTERIYGIDISRYQHEIGRRRYGINWRQLRITSLGKRHETQGATYPVSFIYIKSTESTSIRNRYFANDYAQARKQGIHVGAYHFFSLRTSPQEQANYFLKNTVIKSSDFPPVLDVEPSDAQIESIGGEKELLRRIKIWMQLVEKRTGKRPILYISQMFVNKYMQNADDIKQHYNVWIARYGEYKPDVKLVYWQLCSDGKVNGITGAVDINVFNGYQGQFDEFVRTGFHR